MSDPSAPVPSYTEPSAGSANTGNHKGVVVVNGRRYAASMEHCSLYKHARAAELEVYSKLLRVFRMHGFDAQRSVRHRRMLEDLREDFQISDARHEEELRRANEDQVASLTQASGVLRHREPHFDGTTDLALEDQGSDTDDDGGAFVDPRGTSAANNRRKPGGGGGGSGGPKRQPAVGGQKQRELGQKHLAHTALPPPVAIVSPTDSINDRYKDQYARLSAKLGDLPTRLAECEDSQERLSIRTQMDQVKKEMTSLLESIRRDYEAVINPTHATTTNGSASPPATDRGGGKGSGENVDGTPSDAAAASTDPILENEE